MAYLQNVQKWLEERGVRLGTNTPGIRKEHTAVYLSATCLAVAFLVQALTGIALDLYYSASVTDAWGSVWYIQNEVAWGGLVRGVHYFGASGVVIAGVAHVALMFARGIYHHHGELVWFSGVPLLFLLFGFGLTGYLLPYDQMGYWASQVRTGIVGSLPIIGETAKTILVGGSQFGNLTLTRFASLHTILLPALFLALLAVHWRLLTSHVTREEQTGQRLERATVWALQGLLALLLVGVTLAVAALIEAPLYPPADGGSIFEARPEWYFLFLFQLLKYFEGPLALLGTVVLPGVGTAYLFALPFLDKTPGGLLSKRLKWFAPLALGGVGAIALSAVALNDDATDNAYQKAHAQQVLDSGEASRLVKLGGIGPDGVPHLWAGYKGFEAHGCLGCHSIQDRPSPEDRGGPNLTSYLTREWFRFFLQHPDHPTLYGDIPAANGLEWDMPAIDSDDIGLEDSDSLNAIVEFLVSEGVRVPRDTLNQEWVVKGRELVEEEACSVCHSLEGEEMDGPALNGYGSREWLRDVIRTPGLPHLFGERNSMPDHPDLTDRELDQLIDYLLNIPVNALPVVERDDDKKP